MRYPALPLKPITNVFAAILFGAVCIFSLPSTAQGIGFCSADNKFAIVVHGGAVFWQSDQSTKAEYLRRALVEARSDLANGARALDVIETVVADLESSGIFNAGKGSIANRAGFVEMDASIMDGRSLKAGAIASVQTVRNPVKAARLIMDKSPHVMMVGPGAEKFVAENGGDTVDASYFLSNGQNFENVPLPRDMSILPPDDNARKNMTAFSGIWGGVVDAVQDYKHVLIVEKIGRDSAEVIYALGPHPMWGDGLFLRLPAAYADGGLQVTEPRDLGGYVSTYKLQSDGSIRAVGKAPGQPTVNMVLRRIPKPGNSHNGGTVGAVARDRCGDLAAATSTGGFGAKIPGRVGDSPIIGAGTYANNETVAVSATGHGEFFMRHVVAYAVSAAMKYKGLTVEDATKSLIEDELANAGLRGGVIAVDRDGNVAASYNTRGMIRGSASSDQEPVVSVF